MKHILLIDDDKDYSEIASYALRYAGYSVCHASCPSTAFELLEENHFNLILCDLHMSFDSRDMQGRFVTSYEVGYRTAKELADLFGPKSVALISHLPQSDLMRLSPFISPVPLFSKPTTVAKIVMIVKELLAEDRLSEIGLQ
jgi:CheY-like chemotaxis protein